MKEFLVLYLITMLIVLSLSAQEGDWLWAKKVGWSRYDQVQRLILQAVYNT
jgi:hypothetical protein